MKFLGSTSLLWTCTVRSVLKTQTVCPKRRKECIRQFASPPDHRSSLSLTNGVTKNYLECFGTFLTRSNASFLYMKQLTNPARKRLLKHRKSSLNWGDLT